MSRVDILPDVSISTRTTGLPAGGGTFSIQVKFNSTTSGSTAASVIIATMIERRPPRTAIRLVHPYHNITIATNNASVIHSG